MNGNEETLGKFSAQVMIVMLMALVMWVLLDALRQKRQLEATVLGKTVERGTQTEFNPVNQITVPTSVYCSAGGQCCHTPRGSAKGCRACRWMLLGGDARVCIAYSKTDNQAENIVKDALENGKVVALGPVICSS